MRTLAYLKSERILILGFAFVAAVVASDALFAQGTGNTASSQGNALVQSAYEKCQAAKTIDEMTAAIQICADAAKVKLTAAQRAYIDRLVAWTLNRRGEQYASDASELYKSGKRDEGALLDEKALSDFDTAVAKDETNWKAVHNRGVSLAAIAKLDAALKDFDKAIALRPSHANAWFNRGETHYALGDYEKAVGDYDHLIELSPQDADGFTNRGHAKFRLERFQEALTDYDRAVSLQPENAEARANRADANLSLGLWQSAADDYRRAIDLDKKLGRAYQSAAWLMSTCPDARFRNADLALQSAEKAIELDGQSDYRYLDTLAAALANAGKFKQAADALTEAIKIAPDESKRRLNFCLSLYEDEKPFRQGMFTTKSES